MADMGEPFGQNVPPLIVYLKRVLDKYPEGGQILKELLQNANDAKASHVVFLYDKSHHPSISLSTAKLKRYQGPALYAYNDAIFEPQDWENIQNPEQSGKSDDLLKIGRFGLGFISVYHMTDLPCVLSGDSVGFLDPLEDCFKERSRGYKWKLSTDLMKRYPDQFRPFFNELFHCTFKDFDSGTFNGTVFRFPLRTEPSKISDSVYNDERRMHELFSSFKSDAEISLLFLNFVKSISVYQTDCLGAPPKLLYKVQLTERERIGQNAEFVRHIPIKKDFQMLTAVQLKCFERNTTSVYITVHALKYENVSKDLNKLIHDDSLKLLPWMGASLQLGRGKTYPENHGRTFCFLPLPESEKTGLPVHVHGYFGLGDNRRSITWPDNESLNDKKAKWNQLLVTEVLPQVYARLIRAAVDLSLRDGSMDPLEVYQGWPRQVKMIKGAWANAVRNFLCLLKDGAVIFCNFRREWRKLCDVYVFNKFRSAEFDYVISLVLENTNCRPVACLPQHILDCLSWADIKYNEISPGIVRDDIRGNALRFLTSEQKIDLLNYVTSDTVADLENLQLLPLENGIFASFCKTAHKVYIATDVTPADLIPNRGTKFASSRRLPKELKSDVAQRHTQLKIFSSDDVAPLLRQSLPNAWQQNSTEKQLLWTPGRNQHPPVDWLTHVWTWLASNHYQVPLSSFHSIPLIPLGDITHSKIPLARLQENKMVLRSSSPTDLSEDICDLLESSGVVVVRNKLPKYILKHRNLSRYVNDPTPTGLINVLQGCCNESTLSKCVQEASAKTKRELLRLVAPFIQYSRMNKQHIGMLKQLHLFITATGRYVSAAECKRAVPENLYGIPVTRRLSKHYIMLRDSFDDLALSLGVSKLTESQLLTTILSDVAAKFYSADDSVNIMSWVLMRPQYDSHVCELKFIPAGSNLCRPCDLFEISDNLTLLFGGQSVFPSFPYSQGDIIYFLKRVGLKDESRVSAGDVFTIATEMSTAQSGGHADVERARCLLRHVSCYPNLLAESITSNAVLKPLSKFLEDVCWLACEASPPSDYPVSAGWVGTNRKLYTPRQVGLIEAAMLQGSVLPLIKLPDQAAELLTAAFNWSTHLDPRNYQKVELVVKHLKNLTGMDEGSMQGASQAVKLIYDFLSRAAGSQLQDIFARHMDASQAWLWHGSGFTTVGNIALSSGTLSGISLQPYLYFMPSDMVRNYREFLLRMGVTETFQEDVLRTVLEEVKTKHNKSVSSKNYRTDLNLVKGILSYVVNLNERGTNILVPCRHPDTENRRLVMIEASRCLYVDDERLAVNLFAGNSQDDFTESVVHEEISNDLARRLQLRPLSIVYTPLDELQYGDEFDMAGPRETCINAIRRNLDMYKEVDIFKELIQNADDAAATEVKFLIDWRRNEQTANNLVSDGMRSCHGPAIWAYNNAKFSEKDFTSICDIAAGKKRRQLDKVGRFGLGFTSVYHITDVPSVVSGSCVLICDPRTNHLGHRITSSNPGVKLDLNKPGHRRTLSIYPNQFQPYNGIFGCDLTEKTRGFDGTLFRLPLRTASEGNPQENSLSTEIFDSEKKVNELIDSLKSSSDSLLLFTQNVTHISVQEQRTLNDIKDILIVDLSCYHQMPRSISSEAGDFKTERQLLKAASVRLTHSNPPTLATTTIVKVTKKSLTRGQRMRTEELLFVVSSCMDEEGQLLKLAHSDDGVAAGLLPCGGVAVKLVASEDCLYAPQAIKGKAFSYLPLDIFTGLPFHVNGNFLLQSNRRQLWSKSSSRTSEFEVRWNNCLIRTLLCRAFLNLLQDLAQIPYEGGRPLINAHNFQILWPKISVCDSDFHPFLKRFYYEIGSGKIGAPAVIFSEGSWVAVKDCIFTDWSESEPEMLRVSVKTLLRMTHSSRRWTLLDGDIMSSIRQVGANAVFDKNTYTVDRFLREVFSKMLRDVEMNIEAVHRNRIVLHMLDLRLGERKMSAYDDVLKTTDCIPASPDGEDLLRPEQLIRPDTLIGSLFSEGDCRFPHGEYRQEARLLSLTNLGMACDNLSWEDLCDRAETILEGENAARKSRTLLKLIDKKLGKGESPTSQEKMRIEAACFLPVLEKPAGFPSQWYNCDRKFMSAKDLHLSENLLGSVRPLLDEKPTSSDGMSRRLKQFLGFCDKMVDVCDVVEQLNILTNFEIDPSQQVQDMVCDIYEFLQTLSYTLQNPECSQETHQAFERLRALKSVWCGSNEFKLCSQVVFEYNGRTSGPYLYKVIHQLKKYKHLLEICGVRERFTVQDYLQILRSLKKECPLNESNCILAIDLVSQIASILSGSGNDQRIYLQSEEVYIPDTAGVLQLGTEITYNDMHWEKVCDSQHYTHKSIPYDDAKQCGIITAREKHLQLFSSLSGFETDFGQNEVLTDRLRGILAAYPNESDVCKELLQNADDAGSTEIHFVFDPRCQSGNKVVSESWTDVQKVPALCVFNNKPFTEADIRGIQRIGVGGKGEDVAATGRFGIGFNAVYHLTDCPSFLSNRDTLCVFDPLCRFIPGATNLTPGNRFAVKKEFRDKFPDMLLGYLEDVPKFHEKVGTMFRFPLRMEGSDISAKVVNGEKLLRDFEKVAKESLLFLNNIKSIAVSHIDKETKKLVNNYTISLDLTDEDEKRRQNIAQQRLLFNKDIQPFSEVYSLRIQDSRGKNETWLISQRLGFGGCIDDYNSSVNTSGVKCQIPHGSVAALISPNQSSSSSSSSSSITTTTKRNTGGCAYCVLPLPIKTNLPVHVNGMFELDASRKSLCKGQEFSSESDTSSDSTALIHRWNKILIEKVIAPAYSALLLKVGRMIFVEIKNEKSLKEYLDFYNWLFPAKFDKLQAEWRVLAKATFCYIGQENLAVLPVVRPLPSDQDSKWNVTWHHANSLAYFDNLGTKKTITPLRSFMHRVKFNILSSSDAICKSFQSCDIQAKFVSPQALVHHLSTRPEEIAANLPVPLHETAFQDVETFQVVFKYCLDGVSKPNDLLGLPLCLTNDRVLRQFTADCELYATKHWGVIPGRQELFLFDGIVSTYEGWLSTIQDEQDKPNKLLKEFTMPVLAQYMEDVLPLGWHACEGHVTWEPNKEGGSHPDKEWILNLWSFICDEFSDKTLKTCLQCINNWPIFPSTSGKLFSPALSKKLVNDLGKYCDVENRRKLAGVLMKLHVPIVDLQMMLGYHLSQPSLVKLLNEYLAQPTSQVDVINVLQFMLDTGEIVKLSNTENVTLLQYFQEGVEELSEERLRTIKQLSIFKLLGQDKAAMLEDCKTYYTCSESALLTIDQDWMAHTQCVLLEPPVQLDLIYQKLGICRITVCDLYLKYILKCFGLLNQESRWMHVKYIKDSVLGNFPKEKNEAIVKMLACTRFIPDAQGVLQLTSYFFNPFHPCFEAMVDPNKLLPQSAPIEDLGISFFTKIGLQTKISKELFIQFAKDIEVKARQICDNDGLKKIFDNSYLLIKELPKVNDNLKFDQGFFHTVSEIKFVPSVPIEKELIDVHPAFVESGDHVRFIAYRGSVPEKHLKLIWSVAAVLPYKAEAYLSAKIHKCLGIEEQPAIDKVILHTQNVCDSLVRKNAFNKKDRLSEKERGIIKTLMNEILTFLNGKVGKQQTMIKARLKSTPLCLVEEGRLIIRADQLVYSDNCLEPYLYKIPPGQQRFEVLWNLLGAQQQHSFDQLAGVLAAIHSECGEKALLPNEHKLAEKTVGAVFQLVFSSGGKCELSVTKLYLLSSTNFLKNASDLYFADISLIEGLQLTSTEREFILPLKQLGFEEKEEKTLIQLLPDGLRPRYLGDEMQKRLNDSCKDCSAGEHCPFVEQIKRLVNSADMTRVLLRLIQHQQNNDPPSQEIKQKVETLRHFNNFTCKAELKLNASDSQGNVLAEYKSSKRAFFDKTSNTVYLGHISPDDITPHVSFIQIAKCLNSVLGGLLEVENVNLLQICLKCHCPGEMNRYLSSSDIREYDTKTQSEQPESYRPGMLIPLDIRHLLDSDPYNVFRDGECVGYERSIDEQIDSLDVALGLPPGDEDTVTELVYAVIVAQPDNVNDPVRLDCEYHINDGHRESIIVRVTSLYKFLRVKEKPKQGIVSFTGDSNEGSSVCDENLEENLKEAKVKIEKEVREAFELQDHERKKALKRLFLKWHPDKNLQNQQLATQAFQFLKAEIQRHEKKSQYSQHYSRWESEASGHAEQARHYRENYHQRNPERSNYSVPPSFKKETSDPRNARLWFRQAEENLNIARQLVSHQPEVPTQLIAFQIHQAVEATLTAALFSLTGIASSDHTNNIVDLATKICNHRLVPSNDVIKKIRQLDNLDCKFDKPRRPECFTSRTSGQVYSSSAKFDADQALEICEELFSLIRDIVGIKLF